MPFLNSLLGVGLPCLLHVFWAVFFFPGYSSASKTTRESDFPVSSIDQGTHPWSGSSHWASLHTEEFHCTFARINKVPSSFGTGVISHRDVTAWRQCNLIRATKRRMSLKTSRGWMKLPKEEEKPTHSAFEASNRKFCRNAWTRGKILLHQHLCSEASNW